jgi:hypothetical protein
MLVTIERSYNDRVDMIRRAILYRSAAARNRVVERIGIAAEDMAKLGMRYDADQLGSDLAVADADILQRGGAQPTPQAGRIGCEKLMRSASRARKVAAADRLLS